MVTKDKVLTLSKIELASGDSLPSGVTIKSKTLSTGVVVFTFTKGGNLGAPADNFAQCIFNVETTDGDKSQFAVFFQKVGKGVSLGRIATVPTTYRLVNVTYKNSSGVDTTQSVVYAQSGDLVVLSASNGGYSAGTVFKFDGTSWNEIDDINSCMVAYDDVMSIADGTTAKVICKTLVSQKALIDNLVTKFVNVMEGGYVKSSNYNGSMQNGVPVNVANNSGATKGFALDTNGNAEMMNNVHIGGTAKIDGSTTIGGTANVNGTLNVGGTLNVTGNATLGENTTVGGHLRQGLNYACVGSFEFRRVTSTLYVYVDSIYGQIGSVVRISTGVYRFYPSNNIAGIKHNLIGRAFLMVSSTSDKNKDVRSWYAQNSIHVKCGSYDKDSGAFLGNLWGTEARYIGGEYVWYPYLDFIFTDNNSDAFADPYYASFLLFCTNSTDTSRQTSTITI